MKPNEKTPNLKSKPCEKNLPPLDLSKEQKNAMDWEAVAAVEKILAQLVHLTPIEYQAKEICKEISKGKIPHVRFVYESYKN